jgi:enediyne biosynthesis protein E4
MNDGTGHFTETALSAGVAGDERGYSTGSMGTLVFDADQDGQPDIWVVNFERELFGLYRNDGGGLFSNVSRVSGLAAFEGSFVGFGTVAIDYDMDGDLDLVVSNGHVSYASAHAPFKQKPLLLENSNGRFSRVQFSEGYFGSGHTGRGLASADLDGDGVLDLVVSHLEEPVSLLKGNVIASNPATKIRLIGSQTNRDAIGAVVHVSDGRILMQNGGGSYLSSSEPRLWLTGNPSKGSHRIRIVWPSGKETDYEVPSNERQCTVVE